jgi:hypothetical protein
MALGDDSFSRIPADRLLTDPVSESVFTTRSRTWGMEQVIGLAGLVEPYLVHPAGLGARFLDKSL